MKKTILVDLDGTLLGHKKSLYFHVVFKSLWFLQKRVGWRLGHKILKETRIVIETGGANVDSNAQRVIKRIQEITNSDESFAKELYFGCLQEIFPTFESLFYPIPGACEFIDWASENYELILATNPVWPSFAIDLRIQWSGIDKEKFGYITHLENMNSTKPHLEYYQQLMEKFNLSPENTFMLGDNERKDAPISQLGVTIFLLDIKKEREDRSRIYYGDFNRFKQILSGLGETK